MATKELTDTDFDCTTTESDYGYNSLFIPKVIDTAHIVTTLLPKQHYCKYYTCFTSRNKLFKHIYTNNCTKPVSKDTSTARLTVVNAEPEPAAKNYMYIKIPV